MTSGVLAPSRPSVEYEFGDRAHPVQGVLYCDPDMEDGYFLTRRNERGVMYFCCTIETYRVLSFNRLMHAVADELEKRHSGLHLIPRKCLEPDKAEDVQQAVDYLSAYGDIHAMSPYGDIPESGRTASCSLPHCQQDGVDTSRGFPLCAEDAALLQGWDDLLDD